MYQSSLKDLLEMLNSLKWTLPTCSQSVPSSFILCSHRDRCSAGPREHYCSHLSLLLRYPLHSHSRHCLAWEAHSRYFLLHFDCLSLVSPSEGASKSHHPLLTSKPFSLQKLRKQHWKWGAILSSSSKMHSFLHQSPPNTTEIIIDVS